MADIGHACFFILIKFISENGLDHMANTGSIE